MDGMDGFWLQDHGKAPFNFHRNVLQFSAIFFVIFSVISVITKIVIWTCPCVGPG